MSEITKTGGDLMEKRTAVFSDCGKYRYALEIVWDESKPLCQFIGLNPSTADEMKDDPTLRRCKSFARSWGFGGMVMTNLFAWRDTDPAKMKKAAEPIGQKNNEYLRLTANRCGKIVAAWGNHGTHLARSSEVERLFEFSTKPLECFRLTGAGQPEHPLYMPSNTPTKPLLTL